MSAQTANTTKKLSNTTNKQLKTILCFGDSLCDSGLGATRNPDGSLWPPTVTSDGHKVYNHGKWTDKHTWPELLAQKYEMQLVNYAIAGSTTGIPKPKGKSRPSLRNQMDAYFGTQKPDCNGKSPGKGHTSMDPSTTLVILAWAGPNDYGNRGDNSIDRVVALAKSHMLYAMTVFRSKGYHNFVLTTPMKFSFSCTVPDEGKTGVDEFAVKQAEMMRKLAVADRRKRTVIADFHVLQAQMEREPAKYGMDRATMYKPFVTGIFNDDGGKYKKIENTLQSTSRPRVCYDALHPAHWMQEYFMICTANAITKSPLASIWPSQPTQQVVLKRRSIGK